MSYKLDWPSRLERGDELVAVKRKHGWVIRAQKLVDLSPAVRITRGTLTIPPPRMELRGQDMLGYWRTKKMAEKVIEALRKAKAA